MTDINMPYKNGLELAKEVKTQLSQYKDYHFLRI